MTGLRWKEGKGLSEEVTTGEHCILGRETERAKEAESEHLGRGEDACGEPQAWGGK